MTIFEQAVIDEIKRIRERLAENTDITNFSVTINASGPVHHGEAEISFSCYLNYKNTATGNSIDAVVNEAERMVTWEKRNKPLMISQVKTEETL